MGYIDQEFGLTQTDSEHKYIILIMVGDKKYYYGAGNRLCKLDKAIEFNSREEADKKINYYNSVQSEKKYSVLELEKY